MPHERRRVVLKISGESFGPPGELGIAPDTLAVIAREIADAASTGVEMAVVVGGGNIIRGAEMARNGTIDQSTADYMGMLGTVMNGMALKEALRATGRDSRVMSAIALTAVAEPFIRSRALRHLEKGRIVILVAGTGNPFFTTDSAAALRALEIGAEVLLKATKVDGVYDKDPVEHPDAVKLDRLTYAEVLTRQLKVMDLTAITLCRDNQMPLVVFDLTREGNIKKAVLGDNIGSEIR